MDLKQRCIDYGDEEKKSFKNKFRRHSAKRLRGFTSHCQHATNSNEMLLKSQ